jgi:2'-5' RNA ligase
MKAAIAILADYPIQNLTRRMVFEMSQLGELEFFGSQLPAHVSLKQPFTFENMDQLEAWFDSLAARTDPFEITLDSVYYTEWNAYAIVGFDVVETPNLRNLHNQINQELTAIVADPSAPHDGDEYQFHLTVEMGKTETVNPYKSFYESLPQKRVDLPFWATHLAMFFYTDRPIITGSFMLYRTMAMGIPKDTFNDRKQS